MIIYGLKILQYNYMLIFVFVLQDVQDMYTPEYFALFYHVWKKGFKITLCRICNGQNLGEFDYIFYVISVVLLVCMSWNTLKMSQQWKKHVGVKNKRHI
jgi:hypothetical protein